MIGLSQTSDDLKTQLELTQLRKDKAELAALVNTWAPEFSVNRNPNNNEIIVSCRVNGKVKDFIVDNQMAEYFSPDEVILMMTEEFVGELYTGILRARITSIVKASVENVITTEKFINGKGKL